MTKRGRKRLMDDTEMADLSANRCWERAERGQAFTLEHPGNSLAQFLDSSKRLMSRPDVHVIKYHTCRFEGSRRRKYQMLITNRSRFVEYIGKLCDGKLCIRTGQCHLKWRPTVHGGQVLQFQTGDEREYPIGFCQEYAKAAREVLGETGRFLEVFSGPNAPLSVCVGTEIGSPVPGCKLEHRGKGDKVELQNLAQMTRENPLENIPVSNPRQAAFPLSAQEAFYRSAAVSAGRQPGYGKRSQLIPDGLSDPMMHISEALKLPHPFSTEQVLKPDHLRALETMSALEKVALRDRMQTLGEWKSLASSRQVTELQQSHEALASDCARKLGRKPRTALMELLGTKHSIEDAAVPRLCLTGMPIVGRALESPFFHPYHVPAAITVAELLKSAPLRRANTLKRVRVMAQSGGEDMANAIWTKTMKEVAAGTMSGPYTVDQMMEKHGRYLNLVPSFGLKQGEKYRRIDDHSASHNNLAAERTQQIQMAMVDYLMAMISAMAKTFRTGLVIGTEDMQGAYRQVPLTDSQVRISVTAVYNPILKQAQLFEIFGQPFGAAHAVPNFYRVAEWAGRLMVRAFSVMIDHFFDDYFAVMRPFEAESTMYCIKEAFKLIGLVLDAEKSQPPSQFAMVLGVAFNTASLSQQKILLVEAKPTRVENLCHIVDRIIVETSLAPSLAASLLGKFGFLCSTMFGKVGRCCTGAIRARQYGHPDDTRLTPEILTSLRLMKLFVTTAPSRELRLDDQDPPLILYTDASDVPNRKEGRWVVGAVLIEPNTAMISYTSWIVPTPIVDQWLPKQTYMNQLELFACPLALNTWAATLKNRQVLLFIDNDAAAASLVKGYTPRQDSCLLFLFAQSAFWLLRPNVAAQALQMKQGWFRALLCICSVIIATMMFVAMQLVANDGTKVGMGGAKAFAHSAWHVGIASLGTVVFEVIGLEAFRIDVERFQGHHFKQTVSGNMG
eukprot:s2629_g2.t1